ncbi:MAG: hypothetical protein FJY92_00420 [Candidatus Hydrogenedentes bacterium]|nr:hypothetical protein [Candidatus Hydrogenedentota bacterium]
MPIGALHSFLRHPFGTRGHNARHHEEATTQDAFVGEASAERERSRRRRPLGQRTLVQSREPDDRDGFIHDLKAKVGDQAMQIEFLEKKVEILEDGLRPPPRRPSL